MANFFPNWKLMFHCVEKQEVSRDFSLLGFLFIFNFIVFIFACHFVSVSNEWTWIESNIIKFHSLFFVYESENEWKGREKKKKKKVVKCHSALITSKMANEFTMLTQNALIFCKKCTFCSFSFIILSSLLLSFKSVQFKSNKFNWANTIKNLLPLKSH